MSLDLPKRLRFLAAFHSPDTALYITLREAAKYLDTVHRWQQEGEFVMARKESASAMFALGAWWADRPWRKREDI